MQGKASGRVILSRALWMPSRAGPPLPTAAPFHLASLTSTWPPRSPQSQLGTPLWFEARWSPAPGRSSPSLLLQPRWLWGGPGKPPPPRVLPVLLSLQLSALPAGPEAPRTNGKRKTKSARGEKPRWRGEWGNVPPLFALPWRLSLPLGPPATLSAGPAASPRPGARTGAAPAAPTAPRSPPTTAAPNLLAGRDSPGPSFPLPAAPPASMMGTLAG